MNKALKYSLGIGLALICLVPFSAPIFEKYLNTDSLVNKIGCRLFEFNTISVETESDLDLEQVQIRIKNRIVFKDSQQKARVGQEYGYHIFEVYYADRLLAEVGHFKRNNWYTNQYLFTLSKEGTDFSLEHQISGPDASNDNFQKRYIYDDFKNLNRMEYLNEQGHVYATEKSGAKAVISP